MSGHLTSSIEPVGHEEHYHTSQDESHKDQCRCCVHADSLTGIQGGGYPCPCACPKTLFPAPAQVSDFATPGWRSWSCPKTHGFGQLRNGVGAGALPLRRLLAEAHKWILPVRGSFRGQDRCRQDHDASTMNAPNQGRGQAFRKKSDRRMAAAGWHSNRSDGGVGLRSMARLPCRRRNEL